MLTRDLPAYAIFLFLVVNSAFANEQAERQCNIQPKALPPVLDKNDKSVQVSAKSVKSEQANLFYIEGDVEIRTNTQTFISDKATYNRKNNHLDSKGQITYQEENLTVESEGLVMDITNSKGEATQTNYLLHKQNANGIAEKIRFDSGILELENATYTTCKEGEEQWQLKAESITLNREENEGIARHTRLEIMSVPIFYLPYISFPLEGRKTGFLPPSPGYSTTDGVELSIPYYLNLAPNYDMTLTPRFIEKRGTQFGSEFRFLQKTYKGRLGAEILPSDNQTEDDRIYGFFNAEKKLFSHTTLYADIAHVTDEDYFLDLGNTLNTAHKTQISREIRSVTHGENWSMNTLLQDYQMLSNSAEPFRRLPQVRLNYQQPSNWVQLQAYADYSYFRKESVENIQRLIIEPTLAMPYEGLPGFFIPSVTFRGTNYLQDEQRVDSYHLLYRIDSGLFFDRETPTYTQTLEPRLGYAFVPFKDQTDLPRIDSNLLDDNIEQMFAPNRYGGGDRVGDENKLTWSLASRFLTSESQRELFLIQYAQTLYLKDHKTRLSGERTIENGDTLQAISLNTNPNQSFSGNASVFKYSTDDEAYKGNMDLVYQNGGQHIQLGYRFREPNLEQVSTLGILNLNNQWRFAARWLYSMKEEQTQEALFGLEYNNCCWSVRLMGRRYSPGINSEMKTAVGLQIELTGLARLGDGIDKQFADEVFGNQ